MFQLIENVGYFTAAYFIHAVCILRYLHSDPRFYLSHSALCVFVMADEAQYIHRTVSLRTSHLSQHRGHRDFRSCSWHVNLRLWTDFRFKRTEANTYDYRRLWSSMYFYFCILPHFVPRYFFAQHFISAGQRVIRLSPLATHDLCEFLYFRSVKLFYVIYFVQDRLIIPDKVYLKDL